MEIKCSSIEKVDKEEGVSVEFKTSIFHAANREKNQHEVIAKEIAAFINTKGGELYLGVANDGTIVGLGSELDELARGGRFVDVDGPYGNDIGFTYKADFDSYHRKVQKIVEAYIGQDAQRYLGDWRVEGFGDFKCMVVPVKKADQGAFVRVGRIQVFKSGRRIVTDIVTRTPGKSEPLFDIARDEFIQRKEREKRVDVDSLLPKVISALKDKGMIRTADPSAESSSDDVAGLIKFVLSRKVDESENVENERDYSVWIDECSAMECMDSFMQKDGDKDLFTQLIIKKFSPHYFSLPYSKAKGRWEWNRIAGIDWEMADVEWIVKRCRLSEDEISLANSLGRFISLTNLKKNHIASLEKFVWEDLCDEMRCVKFGMCAECYFKNVFLLKAHTTESWNHGVEDWCQFSGVRFRKVPLREGPSCVKWGERFAGFLHGD